MTDIVTVHAIAVYAASENSWTVLPKNDEFIGLSGSGVTIDDAFMSLYAALPCGVDYQLVLGFK